MASFSFVADPFVAYDPSEIGLVCLAISRAPPHVSLTFLFSRRQGLPESSSRGEGRYLLIRRLAHARLSYDSMLPNVSLRLTNGIMISSSPPRLYYWTYGTRQSFTQTCCRVLYNEAKKNWYVHLSLLILLLLFLGVRHGTLVLLKLK